MPNLPRESSSPSECRSSPTRRANWSGSLRARMKSRLLPRCCAARRCSTKRRWSRSRASRARGISSPCRAADAVDRPHRRAGAPRRPRRGPARRRQCGGAFFERRIFDTDQARRPRRRADAQGRPERRSVQRAVEELLAGSIGVIRRRLFEVVKPARQAAIKQAMAEISGAPEQVESRRDFMPAQHTILALHRDGYLNEGALLGFAKSYRYEESVAALSAMSGVKIATLDRLISGDRHDPILIAGKTIGLEWATVRALLLLRLGPNRVPAPADLEAARTNFVRLMPSTAERGGRVWESR